jgi:phosphocarrier protein HPr
MGTDGEASVRATVVVGNVRGIHARAAAKLVKLAKTFEARVTVTKDGETVGADSILGLLMLAATPGTRLELVGSGRDASKAVDALAKLLSAGDMGEI